MGCGETASLGGGAHAEGAMCWERFGLLLSLRKDFIASRPPLLDVIGPVNPLVLNVTLTTAVSYVFLIVSVLRRASTSTVIIVPITLYPGHRVERSALQHLSSRSVPAGG